jgi:hypothetical protein
MPAAGCPGWPPVSLYSTTKEGEAMVKPSCSDEEFIESFEGLGASGTAVKFGITKRKVFERRRNIEKVIGRELVNPIQSGQNITAPKYRQRVNAPGRLQFDIEDGIVLIGSDPHYWPGETSTSHKAFVKFCKDFTPAAVIMNGDVLDGSTISRHPPIGWESRPKLADEIEACKDRLGEITVAAGKARRFWPLGNHDARFETRLATVAPEYAKVNGVHLHDSFPDWEPCWSVFINDEVVVKHRLKGGIHAPWNNTMNAGRSIVTGHLHSQKVYPLTDYNGTRWGVDAGTMAETFGPQFQDYMEDSPRNWREGFCMLTFADGMLLQPELIRVIDKGRVDFRGAIIEV